MQNILAHLNIFLVKESISLKSEIIREDKATEITEMHIPDCGTGFLYVKSTPDHYPKWVSIFSAYVDLNKIPYIANVSAAFLIKVDDRFYVLTFGQSGRFLIKDGSCEERFGLLVALNSVDKNSFRCIDKQSLDTIQSHTRVQSGHETTSDQFGLDIEQDMLKAIVGSPSDQRLGSRMTGTDSLSVSVKMELSDLSFLLRSYREKFETDLSESDYQWVNNISFLKDPKIINDLECLLLKKFSDKDYLNMWISIPEIIQWDSVKGFIFSEGGKILYPDINISGFLDTIDSDQVISIDFLKRRKVWCADEDHNKVFKTWSIYKCLYAEIDYDGNKYVLNDGQWFCISSDFVNKTNSDLDKIPTSTDNLPPYKGGGEGAYNSSVASTLPKKYALLDDKNKIFHGGGRGQIEVCDLLSIDKKLIHIKIYGKSSVFSHLFSQGFVSGQLMQLDSEFRKKVKNKLASPFMDLMLKH